MDFQQFDGIAHTESLYSKFKDKRILVFGDVMIDRYVQGSVTRISPEAPVPVLLQQKSEDRLGGAANVALNLKALGAEPILVAVVGRDADAEAFYALLDAEQLSSEGILGSPSRRTTVKTRIVGNQQQMLRIDQEDLLDLSEVELPIVLTCLENQLEKADALILQDYNKGVLTKLSIESALKMALHKNVLTAVDPKKNNFFSFKGATLFKPNLKEVRESVPFEVDTTVESLQKAATFLRQKLGQVCTMITLSEKGVFFENGGMGRIYPTVTRNVSDVSGAGDTVVSVATLGLLSGFNNQDLADLSNLAGGQVCEYAGVVPVRMNRLEEEFQKRLIGGLVD